jgi:hypothetical protein
MTNDRQLLKSFLHEHFDLKTLKKAGLIPKEVRLNNYEKIAEIICRRLSLKSIYEYKAVEIRCHLTYDTDCRPSWINQYGEYQTTPFVETISSIY